MSNTEWIGRDSTQGYDLYVLHLRSPEDLPAKLWLASPRFKCLLALDARHTAAERITRLARQLIDAGAVTFCCWGEDCERVHDLIDQAALPRPLSEEIERVIMTTWHADEPLAEAIFSVLHTIWPDESYYDGCQSIVGVSIGPEEWTAEIRGAFLDYCNDGHLIK